MSLCVKHERVAGRGNCVRYDGRIVQIPEQRHCHHFVKSLSRYTNIPRHDRIVFTASGGSPAALPRPL
jgi:hypothetical protein